MLFFVCASYHSLSMHFDLFVFPLVNSVLVILTIGDRLKTKDSQTTVGFNNMHVYSISIRVTILVSVSLFQMLLNLYFSFRYIFGNK